MYTGHMPDNGHEAMNEQRFVIHRDYSDKLPLISCGR